MKRLSMETSAVIEIGANTIKASKIEFQFADLDILTNEEYDFLGHIIYEAETIPAVSEKSLSTTNRGKI